tara:strand:+ start:297 stop:458 length:162 start_codon:yes stop_codon:yes gene_type:complete
MGNIKFREIKKVKRPEHLEVYDGNGKYSFVNATIWQCIKFWLITKLTGTDLEK